MKTVLYDKHVAAGAKIVDFGGWQMPLQYRGIVHEHNAVRNSVGIFDVSHMGRVVIEGPDSEKLLDYLSTNKIVGKKDGTAVYTVWCREDGSAVDDLLVYRINQDSFFVIVNASNRQKDFEHLQKHADGYDVVIKNHFDDESILAVQGPKAESLVAEIFPDASSLKPMTFCFGEYLEQKVIVSRTGYTGSGGFEIYGPHDVLVALWDVFIERGAEPIGLGARDTLRLEMGFALYGHELSDKITPLESIASWAVKLNKEQFLGKDALVAKVVQRHQYGVVLSGRGIAREGYKVFKDGKEIGIVTSGTFGPSLNKAVAIVLVDGDFVPGDELQIAVRNSLVDARVEKLPFYKE